MIKATLLFSILMLHINSWSYELISFLGDRQLHSVEEILMLSKVDITDILKFSCSNKRQELFTNHDLLNTNESFKIIGQNKILYTYKKSTLFNQAGESVTSSDDFVNKTLKALRKIEKTPSGRRIVETLQKNPKELRIKKGWAHYSPYNIGQRPNHHINEASMVSLLDQRKIAIKQFPFHELGFGGLVFWNPDKKHIIVESDWQKREGATFLTLAHELYHAYDGVRGILDTRHVKSEQHELQPVAEYRAVRFENIIRAENGYLYRRYYNLNPDFTSPDMLDKYDKPIKMESPCVRWIDDYSNIFPSNLSPSRDSSLTR